MKRLILCAILGVLGTAPAMFADIADYMLNINGTTYCPSYTAATCSNYGSLSAAPGTTSTLPGTFGGSGPSLGDGTGTVDVTFNPGAAGSYNVDLWLFEQLASPSYNEYGATGGTATGNQSGLSYQIDVPDYDYVGELSPTNAGNIIANTAADTLGDVNNVPGKTTDYLADCSGPTCNDFVSTALGFDFTLAAGEEELLSFTVSTTAPSSGFYLEQIHPADGSNSSETDYYYTATATTESICTVNCSAVPEPSSTIPLLAFVGVLALVIRRRLAVV